MKLLFISSLLISCSVCLPVYANSVPKGYCSVVVCDKNKTCHTTVVEESKGKKGVTLRNQLSYTESGKKEKITLKVKRVIKCNKQGGK